MTAFLIKSAIAMAVLLTVYHLLLEREKMHRFNRFYLLGALIFSGVVPFINIPVYVASPVQAFQATAEVSEVIMAPQITHSVAPGMVIKPATNYIPYIVWSIYCIVTLLLAIRFAINISYFIRKSARNEKVPYKNATLVLLKEKTLPHTFLNYIFINEDDYRANAIEDDLYTHELTHVKQRHTIDILFIEVLKTIFWFNPLLYFYKKAIQLNHEFLADEGVIKTSDTPKYQRLLLQKTAYSNIALASNLTFSLTKKRFNMMTKTTPKWKSALLKICIAPATIVMLLLLCTETIAKNNTSPIQHSVAVTQDTLTEKDKKRDRYYAGVRVKIEDKWNDVTIDKPYEELTLEQKRKYLFIIPEPKVKKNPSTHEFEEYKNKSKYAIWLDDKNIDNAVLNNYKNTDIAYIIGSSVYKNARTKQHPQPYQFHLYTNSYFDENLKDEHLTYPSNEYTLTIAGKNAKTTPNKKKNGGITSYPVDYAATDPDKFAGFKDGFKNFPKYVENNFKNPYQNESGTLLRFKYIFDIEADGTISNIKIERITENPDDVNRPEAAELERELKKVIKLSQPQWFPAIKNGKPIRSTVAMPFVLDTKI